jgi:uncharacterized membrane protein
MAMTKRQLPSDPNNQRNQIKTTQQSIAVTTFHGPLPPPDTLAQYESVCPGAADRILGMAESQVRHRQELEVRASKTNSRDSLLGVVFAFLIGIAAITVGGLVVVNGHPVAGTLFSGAGLGSLVGAFIYGTRTQNNDPK